MGLHRFGCGALMLALAFSGCAIRDEQADGVRKYGRAVETASSLAGAQLVRMRGHVIELNARLASQRGYRDAQEPAQGNTDQRWPLPKQSLAFQVGQREPVPFDTIVLDDRVDPASIEKVISALRAAEAFGAALTAIVDEDPDQALREAGAELTDALKKAKKSDGSQLVSNEKATAIGAIVRGVGSLFAESQRRDALQDLVTEFHQIVPDLLAVIQPMFDLSAENASVVALVYTGASELARVTRRRLDGEPLKSEGAAGLPGTDHIAVRRIIMDDHQYAVARLQDIQFVHRQIAAAFEGVQVATDRLVALVQDEGTEIEDVERLYKLVKDLKNQIQTLGGGDR